MDSFLQTLLGQVSGGTLDTISDQLGTDNQSTQQAIGLALPLLMGSLTRNASSKSGAGALADALRRDHDGSILDDLAANIGRQEVADDGLAILGHVLGDKSAHASESIGKASGLDAAKIMQLLSMLAPVVLGVLGQTQRKKALDSAGVASLLTEERERAHSQLPGIASLIDRDADGDITDEMISLGGSLLTKFLTKN